MAARTCSFIFRQLRKLVFRHSMKGSPSSTKRSPTGARLRPRTSRSKRERAIGNGALSDVSGSWAKKILKNCERSAERASLLHARWLTRARTGRSIFRDPFLDRHHVGWLQVAARPEIDDPLDLGGAIDQHRGVVRRLQHQRIAAIFRVADRVMLQQ